MAKPLALDSDWLRKHPLPLPDPNADKNARGKAFLIGGSRRVPGGLLLTAEAALRAGAGKVQVAVPKSIALSLGTAMPEIAVFAAAETPQGEIRALDTETLDAIARSDAVIAGPAMCSAECGGAIIDNLLAGGCEDQTLVLDAAALMELSSRGVSLSSRSSRAILTPHIGEMAAMLDCEAEEIEADRAAGVCKAAAIFGSVVVLKGSTTLVASPAGDLFGYAGGGVGLATGGSGDVLAGIAGGLAAKGGDPLEATLWAVWLHGEAGRRCAEKIGPVGYLSRELLAHIPGLLQAF